MKAVNGVAQDFWPRFCGFESRDSNGLTARVRILFRKSRIVAQ